MSLLLPFQRDAFSPSASHPLLALVLWPNPGCKAHSQGVYLWPHGSASAGISPAQTLLPCGGMNLICRAGTGEASAPRGAELAAVSLVLQIKVLSVHGGCLGAG